MKHRPNCFANPWREGTEEACDCGATTANQLAERDRTIAALADALELRLNTTRLCGVCLGTSPPWDGHDVHPPCQGHAIEQMQQVLVDHAVAIRRTREAE